MSIRRIACLLLVVAGTARCQDRQDGFGEDIASTSQPVAGVPSALGPSEYIEVGQFLQSLNGQYKLTLDTTGDVVIERPDYKTTLNTGSPATDAWRLIMQGDGNLVLYTSTYQPRWHTGTDGNSGARLVLENDGHASIYRTDGVVAWTTRPGVGLESGRSFTTGQKVVSPNGRYAFSVVEDGNVVLSRTDDGTHVWTAGTAGQGGKRLLMQPTGDLVLYPNLGAPLWSTPTAQYPGARFTVRDDGNAIIQHNGTTVWSTNSIQPPWGYVFAYAGSGVAGLHQPDSTPALQQMLSRPSSVTTGTAGKQFIADAGNNMILVSTGAQASQWDTSASWRDRNSENMIVNPSGEATPTTQGWEVPTGQPGTWESAPYSSCSGPTSSAPCSPMPFDGVRFFSPGTAASTELRQDVPIVNLADVDAGTATFVFTGFVRSASKTINGQPTPDKAAIKGEFLNANKAVIGTFFDSQWVADATKWTRVYAKVNALPQSRYIRVRLLGERVKASGHIDAFFDGLSLVRYSATGINNPQGVLAYSGNRIYVADSYGHRIVRLLDLGQAYTTVIGTSEQPGTGTTKLNCPRGLGLRAEDGTIFIADTGNHRVMRYGGGGLLSTAAGVGTEGFSGDGGLAWNAQLNHPSGVAVGATGDVYIADRNNHVVRKVAAGTSVITTFAGNAPLGAGFSGDGGPATNARLYLPDAVAVAPDGSIYISDSGNHVVRRVKNGTVTTIAGTKPGATHTNPGSSGDGGSALMAKLRGPAGLAFSSSNDLYIADRENHRVRVVSCSDRDVCNGAEALTPGACLAGTPITVSDNNACTADLCDPVSGTVTHPMLATDDGDGCTTDSCTASGGITHVTRPAGSACNDDDVCSTNDVCLAGSGRCLGSSSPVPNDNNPCTIDVCHPITGQTPVPDEGATCSPVGCQPGASCERFCSGAGECEQSPPFLSAPTLDLTAATPFAQRVKFIYEAPNGVQVGMAANTIMDDSAALVSGRVTMPDGAALSNVTVSFANAPQYGSTRTRADGRFDLVVNGTPNLVLRFHKTLYFDVDRTITVAWNQSKTIDDVIMKHADWMATEVDLGAPGIQEAVSSISSDEDGDRQVVMMIPEGTDAQIRLADGSTVQLDSMTLRMTEYTVGQGGPASMPGPLPPTTAYTYAVEISADEAISTANAKSVEFTRPVPVYVDNFLEMPVGEAVPAGYYDKDKQAWVPSESGVVIRVVSVTNGVAAIDATKDNLGAWTSADEEALGLQTPAELQEFQQELARLGTRYEPGDTLWRVMVEHLTPWDFNWPKGPPPCEGVCPGPTGGGTGGGDCGGGCPSGAGSIIEFPSQGLGERLDVAGTPFTLNYRSTRELGYGANREIRLNLTGPVVHSQLQAIEVAISVAGQRHFESYSVPGPNFVDTYVWDGRDTWGRPVIGATTANVVVNAVYPAVYLSAEEFAAFSAQPGQGITGDRATNTVRYPNEFSVELLGTPPLDGWSLGGWSLSPHHFFDQPTGRLYRGDGTVEQGMIDGYVVRRIAGNGGQQWVNDGSNALSAGFMTTNADPGGGGGIAASGAGDVYIADSGHRVVRRIDTNGLIQTVAGTRDSWPCSSGTTPGFGDGQLATTARLYVPLDTAIGPDGSLYISDGSTNSIRRVRPGPSGTVQDGIIETVAGPATCPLLPGAFSGDGGPATAARLNQPAGIAVAGDGSVYFADYGNDVIRKIDPAGTISTVAGNGQEGGSRAQRHNVLAVNAPLGEPVDVAVGPDGTLYIPRNAELLSVQSDGIMRVMNGYRNSSLPVQDGVPLLQEGLDEAVTTVAVDANTGFVFFNDSDLQRAKLPDNLNLLRFWVRGVDPAGVIHNVSAGIAGTIPTEGAVALRAGPWGVTSLAVSPTGVLVSGDRRIYELQRPSAKDIAMCGGGAAYFLPSGNEGYCFDLGGRHLSTVDLRTQATLYSFFYDAGRLTSIVDIDLNTTSIVRGSDRYTIIGPYGQQTVLMVDSNGHVTSIADAARTALTEVAPNGLLNVFTDRNGIRYEFGYEPYTGLLISDRGAVGTGWDTTQTLTRSFLPTGRRVEHWTPLLRKTAYDFYQDAGAQIQKFTQPDGTSTVIATTSDTSVRTTSANGTISTRVQSPSVRFGMRNPVTSTRVQTPSGLGHATDEVNESLLAVAGNPASYLTETRRTIVGVVNGVGGAEWRRTFDRATSTETILTPMLRTVSKTLDAAGRTTRVQAPGISPIDISYDRGRIRSLTTGSRATIFDYDTGGDSNGYLGSITKAITNDVDDITDFTRDAVGRTTTETRGPSSIGFGWDPKGNLTRVTPAGRSDHLLTYSAFGALKTYNPPDIMGIPVDTTVYWSTDDRSPQKETRQGSLATTHEYDEFGRLWKVTRDSSLATFAYYSTAEGTSNGSAPGRIKSITGPYTVNLAYTYDGFLTTKATWSGGVVGSVAWTHNGLHQRTRETVSDGSTSRCADFSYDADGLLICARQAASCAPGTTPSCDPLLSDSLRIIRDTTGPNGIERNGRLARINLGNVEETLAYNSFDEIASQIAKYNGSEIFKITYDDLGTYQRDGIGRVRRKTEVLGGASPASTVYDYEYNSRGQLTDVFVNGTAAEHFDYGLNGNREAANIGTDAQDRLTMVGSTTYEYTTNGELLKKTAAGQITQYTYDAAGNLTKVALPSGATVDYVADGMGRRVSKKRSGGGGPTVQRRWLYRNNLRPVAELDGNGVLVAQFVYGSKPNVPDYVIKGGNTYRVIADQLGSPRYVVNVNNSLDVPYRATYSAFGVATGTALDWMPFGFAGGIYDPDTGLVRFGVRDYDPQVGRWVSKDPARFVGGPNLFAYANNDPVNSVDPDGRFPIVAAGVAAAAYAGCLASAVGATDRYAKAPGSIRDKQQHCVASCVGAQHCTWPGIMAAAVGWEVITGFNDFTADMAANLAGAAEGDNGGDCAAFCDRYGPCSSGSGSGSSTSGGAGGNLH